MASGDGVYRTFLKLRRPSATERRRALLNQAPSTTSLFEEWSVKRLGMGIVTTTGGSELFALDCLRFSFFSDRVSLGTFTDLLLAIINGGSSPRSSSTRAYFLRINSLDNLSYKSILTGPKISLDCASPSKTISNRRRLALRDRHSQEPLTSSEHRSI